MISKGAEAITDWLMKNRTIDESEMVLYQYAVESLFLSLSAMALAIGIGWILGNVMQSIVLITPFMCLRKFSGGYHARNLKICLLCSSLLFFLCLTVSMRIRCSQSLAAVTILSAIMLMVFSPAENPNRTLEAQEKNSCQKATVVLALVFLFLAAITYLIGLKVYTKSICVSIQLSALLQIPCVLKICGKATTHSKRTRENDQKNMKNVVSCKIY